MYQSHESMEAVLAVSDYVGEAASRRDRDLLRDRSWQLVATESQLQSPGDYVATERFGIPVVVRNHGGELTALRNVCAHRNCQIVESGCGKAAELKCPYHGWQYGADGLTRKIPGAMNFPQFNRDQHRLDRYPLRRLGPLVMVYLGENPKESLEDFTDWEALLCERTHPDQWQALFQDRLDYPCDWKVVIEGSLESYHLSEVHAETFGSDPGEENSDHAQRSSGSSFETRVRESSFLSRLEERLIRYLSGDFDPTYRHVHVYPGIMASMTDTITLVYQIFPTQTGHSAMEVFAFSRKSDNPTWGQRGVAKAISQGAKKIARQVLAEDAAIFPQVQSGMEAAAKQAAPHPRIFGRCEERLHWFGQHWNQVKKGDS